MAPVKRKKRAMESPRRRGQAQAVLGSAPRARNILQHEIPVELIDEVWLHMEHH